MKHTSITQIIGNTPCLRLKNLFPRQQVWIKLEHQNPGGSIKDRIALAMVEDAEKKQLLTKESTIIEASSGNTGIGLAMIAAAKAYRMILVMPENMSIERKNIAKAYGAELKLSPAEKGMRGAIELAEELHYKTKNSWMPKQFENMANPEKHFITTAEELIEDFSEGIDVFIGGIGTGGHISGIGRKLKSKFPHVKIIGVEPENSAVLNGRKAGKHKIQGIGAGFIPKTLDRSILDCAVSITDQEAYAYTQKCAKNEGLLIGISTGAVLAAINKVCKNTGINKTIVCMAYDSGERYLSVSELFT